MTQNQTIREADATLGDTPCIITARIWAEDIFSPKKISGRAIIAEENMQKSSIPHYVVEGVVAPLCFNLDGKPQNVMVGLRSMDRNGSGNWTVSFTNDIPH